MFFKVLTCRVCRLWVSPSTAYLFTLDPFTSLSKNSLHQIMIPFWCIHFDGGPSLCRHTFSIPLRRRHVDKETSSSYAQETVDEQAITQSQNTNVTGPVVFAINHRSVRVWLCGRRHKAMGKKNPAEEIQRWTGRSQTWSHKIVVCQRVKKVFCLL